MGECLKTQLKGSVNANLPILNVIRFEKDGVQESFDNNFYVRVVPTADGVLNAKLNNGLQFLDDYGDPMENTVSIPSYGVYLHLPLGACLMYLEKKYVKAIETSMVVVGLSKIYLSDICYAEDLETLQGVVVGDIENLASCTKLKTIDFEGLGGINGNIANAFGNCIQLTTIRLNQGNVSGSIESFVAAQRLAGRTIVESAFPLTLNITGTEITFNGDLAATAVDTQLYWDASTITYNGVTINA